MNFLTLCTCVLGPYCLYYRLYSATTYIRSRDSNVPQQAQTKIRRVENLFCQASTPYNEVNQYNETTEHLPSTCIRRMNAINK